MTANIAIKSELSVILPIIFSIFCRAKPNLHFLSVARKKTEAKERARKRPELRGRNTNSSNHSMNSLRSNSISYFVPQIAFRNPRLNIDSKNLHSSKDLFVRNVFEELRDEKAFHTSAVTALPLGSSKIVFEWGFGGKPPLEKYGEPCRGCSPRKGKGSRAMFFIIGCAMSNGCGNYRKRK